MTFDPEKDLSDLQQRLRISPHSIADAEEVWRKRNDALLAGLHAQATADVSADAILDNRQLVAHRDRYLSIERYCDEARELLSRYRGELGSVEGSEVSGGEKIFLIDPHVMVAYCEFWRRDVHTGFEFFDGELDDEERMDYQLFVYASLLSGNQLGLPNAARQDLSRAIAFYVEEHRQRSEDGRNAQEIYKELKSALLAAPFAGKTSEQLDYIHNKATSLATSVAGAAERQSLALARMKKLMTSGAFFVPEALVRNKFKNEPDKVSRFSRLVQAIRTDPSKLNDSHLDLSSTYDRFRRLTDFSRAPGSEADRKRPIRGGEQIDLDIVQEVHFLNSALKVSDIDCEFVYITLSRRIYNFLSAFSQQDLFCPIIHPRSALVYRENKLAKDQRDALETALSSPIAFGRGIPKDDFIRPEELSNFEATMGTVLKATREAFSYSAVTQSDGLDHFFDAFQSIFENSSEEKFKTEGLALIKGLRTKFEKVADLVGDAYSKAISHGLSEETWQAYQNFSAKLTALDSQPVSIRRYEFEGSEVASRYAVIPLTRGFRHLFVLHNAFLDDPLLKAVGGEETLLSMSELLTIAIGSVEERLNKGEMGDEERARAKATRFFLRACYAACNGEWNLVHSMTSNGRTKLGDYGTFDDATELNVASARSILIGQELSFLRHLADRALAESSTSPNLHSSRLTRAAGSLYESSVVTVNMPKEFAPYVTAYSPSSVRDGLAAIGLLLEWWLKGSWRQLTSRDHIIRPLLCATQNHEIVWSNIEFLTREIDREELDGSTLLVDAANSVLAKAKECLEFTKELNPNGNETWRYLVLRAHAMTIMASQVSGVLAGNNYDGADYAQVEEMRRLRMEHNKKFQKCRVGGSAQTCLDHNPFTDGLLGIERFLRATHRNEEGKIEILDLPEAIRAFADVDQNCSELYRFGFPRMYLRRAKELLIYPILGNLRTTYLPREVNF